jgi:hypothetical protein
MTGRRRRGIPGPTSPGIFRKQQVRVDQVTTVVRRRRIGLNRQNTERNMVLAAIDWPARHSCAAKRENEPLRVVVVSRDNWWVGESAVGLDRHFVQRGIRADRLEHKHRMFVAGRGVECHRQRLSRSRNGRHNLKRLLQPEDKLNIGTFFSKLRNQSTLKINLLRSSHLLATPRFRWRSSP